MKSLVFKPASKRSPVSLALMFSAPFVIISTILFAALVLWEVRTAERNFTLEMTEAAKAYVEQIKNTRLWNASHGGVYVEITDKTRPNPYLIDPERDITSTSGKQYTKINPAYMTRQISEIAKQGKGYQFHLTSLKLLNPGNRADEWEQSMLEEFETGRAEARGSHMREGMEYFRYMVPLLVQQECLKCHAKQGYKVGDIRGAISVSVPVGVQRALHQAGTRRSIMAYAAISVISIAFVFGSTLILSRRISRGLIKEVEYEKLTTAVQLAGAAAHELRQPLSVMLGFVEILKDKTTRGEPINYEADVIITQCERMNATITRMLNVTKTKTKAYGDGSKIIDLDDQ